MWTYIKSILKISLQKLQIVYPVLVTIVVKLDLKFFECFARKSNHNKNNLKLNDPIPKTVKQIRFPKTLPSIANPFTTNHEKTKKFGVGECSSSFRVPNIR